MPPNRFLSLFGANLKYAGLSYTYRVKGLGYSVRPLCSAEMRLSANGDRTFGAISDPANAEHFSLESALKAFAHVKV